MQHEFDFDGYFDCRFRPHKKRGSEQKPGTFVVSEDQLMTDLVYEIRRNQRVQGGKIVCAWKALKGGLVSESKAKAIIKDEIAMSDKVVSRNGKCFLSGEEKVKYDESWNLVPYSGKVKKSDEWWVV